jgi:hypothetical protein
MQTCYSPFQIGYVILVVMLSFVIIAGSNVLIRRLFRQERDRSARRMEQVGIRVSRVVTTLETIRDLGPSGPDPLPPCKFCGQGPGHWTKPADEKCPSVIAWRALRNFNRDENELIETVVRV